MTRSLCVSVETTTKCEERKKFDGGKNNDDMIMGQHRGQYEIAVKAKNIRLASSTLSNNVSK